MNKENGIKRLNRLSVKAKEYRDENTQVVKLSQAIEVVELLGEPDQPDQHIYEHPNVGWMMFNSELSDEEVRAHVWSREDSEGLF